VVAVLAASGRVDADGLQVAVGVGAHPDLPPGRRDRQLADAGEHGFVVDRPAVLVHVAEAPPVAATGDTGS